jgi:hypothetical protein
MYGLCSSLEILNTRKHNVPETGCVSVLRLAEEDTYSVGSLRKSLPQSLRPGVNVSVFSPDDGNISSFGKAVFSSYFEFGTNKV